MSNLPPGCSVYDLPGYLEYDIEFTAVCPECGIQFDEEAVVEPGDHTVDVVCPKCKTEFGADIYDGD